ncbi:MAG: orotate phosphoribosyltransferase [Deltaproteobacteria bacterium]|nr:orotate phosphoribosyltransferase [Deltaproteobacteria bacterium]
MMYGNERDILLRLLVELSYVEGEVLLASGKKSTFYVDCRKTALTSEGHYLIGKIMLSLIREHFPEAEAVGGVALGGCSLASSVSLISHIDLYPLDAFYLRKEAKSHGMGKILEGNIPPGTKCVLVEDVVTSGASTLDAIQKAENEGIEVIGVVVLVDREEQHGMAKIAQKVPVIQVFKKSDILAAIK